MSMATAFSLQYDQERIASVAYDLSENFRSTTRHAEAAILLFDYCNDVEGGVSALLEGNEWREAIRRVFILFYCSSTTTYLIQCHLMKR